MMPNDLSAFFDAEEEAEAPEQQFKFPKGDLSAFFELDNAPTVPASMADMPNADRLTPSERWMYKQLPGFSQSTVGQALAKFGESGWGKALSYLDVAAEGMERTLGVARQLPYMMAEGDYNLAAAWYAGSLFADMTNLPVLKRDKDGKVIGVRIPTDLPGVEGLARARKQIADMMKVGVDPGQALIQAREEYQNDLGALALRTQLYDTYFHIFADPANYILPALKPVERLQAARTLALAGKIPVDELVDLERVARASGNIAEAERIAHTIARVGKGELRPLTVPDKIAIFMTGGNPLEPNALAKGFIGKINPMTLKPESRAQELITMLTDHVGAYIVSPHWDDPEAVVATITRASKGALGPEFGHAFLSIEGRTAQGYLGTVSAQAQDLLGQYRVVQGERSLLNMLAGVLDEDAGRLLIRLGDEPEAVMAQLMNKVDMVPELRLLADAGQLTAEELGRVGKTLKALPYDSNSFMTELLIRVEDAGMQQAILQFGVEARGALTRWSLAVKSAETLAFLRLNPGYAIRNFVNNEMTMLSRGVWNAMSPDQIGEFWATVGFRPRRMAQGFGMVGEHLGGRSKAAQALEKALRGGKFDAPEKVRDFFNKVNLGKADVSNFARVAEESASTRAFTGGYIDAIRTHFWKPGKGYERIADALPPQVIDDLRKIDPDLPEIVERAVQSSGAVESALDEALKTNSRVNFASALGEAETRLGYKIDEVLDPEMMEIIARGIPDAVKNGKVEEFFAGVRSKLDAHLDDLIEKNIQDLPGLTAEQVKAGGPQMFYRKFGDIADEYWAGEIEHAIRMPDVTEAARAAQAEGDFARADVLWEKIFSDSDKFFTRRDKRLAAIMEGLEKGGKEAGVAMPGEVRSSFKEITGGWRKFFKARNEGYRALKGLKDEEFTTALNKLRGEMDTRYGEMIELEERLAFQIDDAVAGMIDDPQLQGAFRNWRNMMADMRKADKEITANLMKQVRDMPADLRQKTLEKFWADRHLRYLDMHNTDQVGMQMLEGDPQAAQMLAGYKPRGYNYQARKLVKTYGVKGGPAHVKNIVNKFLRGEYTDEAIEKAKQIADISEIDTDLLKQSLRARLVAGQGEVPEGMELADFLRILEETPEGVAELAGESRVFIGNMRKMLPDPMPIDMGLNNLAYGRTQAVIDALEDSVRAGTKKTPLIIDQLPKEAQEAVQKYLTKVRGQMGDTRYAATRFAEFRRDSALLNYNRRNNFDSWTAIGFPYAFWTTSSIAKWAVHSIDRPAMLTTFMRIRKFVETAGSPDQAFPSRLRKAIKVKIPFAPEWMGEQFIDPVRMALPFDIFAMPYEQYQQKRFTLEGRAERLLNDMLHDGEITQAQYEEAMEHQGSLWDRATAKAQLDDKDLKYDAWDFATLMTSPHAPIAWAYNAARGTPEDIGPFTPMSRTLKNVATTLGIKDWNNSPLNVEAKVRKALGLPAFDRWDDYRTQRMISNMTATMEMTADEAKRAMILVDDLAAGKITQEQAQQSPIWEKYQEAVYRANQEYAGGPVGTILGTLGMPVKAYPTGEKIQRSLQNQFFQAYDAYQNGNVKALTKFFDDHPEYETRLALWDEPEERLGSFLNDQMWSVYNELPALHRRDLRDALGDEFSDIFLPGQGRNLPPEKIQIWLKLAGADPIGTLSADARLISEFFDKVQYTDPEMAWRVQGFYNARTELFPDWYEVQSGYYDLPPKERPGYLRENPGLKEYWDFRTNFMSKNPDTVPYLTDNEKTVAKFARKARVPGIAVPTAREFAAQLSQPMIELLSAGEVSDTVIQRLAVMGDPYDLTGEDVLNILLSGK